MKTRRSFLKAAIRPGLTLVELLVIIAIIGILVCLLFPSTRSAREAARRMMCSNNLRDLGLALHNYHESYGQFPTAMGGTGSGATPVDGNANRLSGLVALLPYMEQQPLWDQISKAAEFDGVRFPPMGPAPWVETYAPWRQEIAAFRCPSAGGEPQVFGQTNYAFSVGDVVQAIHRPKRLRGAFACGVTSCIKDFSDGTSNTIAMAEIGTPSDLDVIGRVAANQPAGFLLNPSLCLALRAPSARVYLDDVPLREPGRGGRWADGAAEFSLFNTVLPPNSPSCATGRLRAADGLYSAGSLHPGGSLVVLADASVHFISETIDAGDPTHSPVTPQQLEGRPVASPFGVWGALGSLSGHEEVDAIP